MEKIKRMFIKEHISWLYLFVFSIVCGIVTGLIALMVPFFQTSMHNIATCYEMWVFLAMFIILNCKSPFEAALKTFLFFLISQPLCYLVQVPFYYNGFGIFIYYKFWAFLTLLTFPGAFIAWYTKKGNIFSMFILSFANFLLVAELYSHFFTLINSFPYQFLAVLFIVFELIFFINILFKKRIQRFILYFSTVIMIIPIHMLITRSQNVPQSRVAILELDSTISDIIETNDNVSIEINDNMLVARTTVVGEYHIKLRDFSGNIVDYLFIVDDDDAKLIKK